MANNPIDIAIEEEVFGKVPCDKWTAGSMGSAGGPMMFSPGFNGSACGHKPNTCYAAVPGVEWPGNYGANWSTNMQAAMHLFVHMVTVAGSGSIYADMEEFGRGAVTGDGAEQVMHVSFGYQEDSASVTDRLPLAICRAALEYVRGHA